MPAAITLVPLSGVVVTVEVPAGTESTVGRTVEGKHELGAVRVGVTIATSGAAAAATEASAD
jgi:hypothetical protein